MKFSSGFKQRVESLENKYFIIVKFYYNRAHHFLILLSLQRFELKLIKRVRSHPEIHHYFVNIYKRGFFFTLILFLHIESNLKIMLHKIKKKQMDLKI